MGPFFLSVAQMLTVLEAQNGDCKYVISLIEVGTFKEPIELMNPIPQNPRVKENKGFYT